MVRLPSITMMSSSWSWLCVGTVNAGGNTEYCEKKPASPRARYFRLAPERFAASTSSSGAVGAFVSSGHGSSSTMKKLAP